MIPRRKKVLAYPLSCIWLLHILLGPPIPLHCWDCTTLFIVLDSLGRVWLVRRVVLLLRPHSPISLRMVWQQKGRNAERWRLLLQHPLFTTAVVGRDRAVRMDNGLHIQARWTCRLCICWRMLTRLPVQNWWPRNRLTGIVGHHSHVVVGHWLTIGRPQLLLLLLP